MNTHTPLLLLLILILLTLKTVGQIPLTPDKLLERLQPSAGKVSAVIDTDAFNEIDDQFAVVYALLSPENIDVKAIYAAPFKNKRADNPAIGMQKSYDEILNLLKKLGIKNDGLVYKGSDQFLKSLEEPVNSEAARDLAKKAMEAKDVLYVLTLGAPTNVVSAILLEPKIIDKIVVVWLGGTSPDWHEATEFNLRQDLMASQYLFNCGVPLVQLPTLPVTSHLITTIPEVEHYLKGQGTIGDYLCSLMRDYSNDRHGWSKVIWDISAIAYVIGPQWFRTEIRHSPVLTSNLTYSVDRTRHFYRVATRVNRDMVFGDMFAKIRRHNSDR